jgi:GNAT superfamily N-acetyltransferase
MEWENNGFTVSTDKSKLSLDTVHEFLTQKSYWAQTRTREQVAKSFEGSICFGVYDGGRQVGFARVVTDYATFYWLCDVFIVEKYRGKALGKWLVECIVGYDELKGLKGLLATRDADGLYEKYGFVRTPAGATIFMRRQ